MIVDLLRYHLIRDKHVSKANFTKSEVSKYINIVSKNHINFIFLIFKSSYALIQKTFPKYISQPCIFRMQKYPVRNSHFHLKLQIILMYNGLIIDILNYLINKHFNFSILISITANIDRYNPHN